MSLYHPMMFIRSAGPTATGGTGPSGTILRDGRLSFGPGAAKSGAIPRGSMVR